MLEVENRDRGACENFPGVYDSVTIAFHHQMTFNSNISHCYRLLDHISLKTSSTDALFPSSAEQHFELNLFLIWARSASRFSFRWLQSASEYVHALIIEYCVWIYAHQALLLHNSRSSMGFFISPPKRDAAQN